MRKFSSSPFAGKVPRIYLLCFLLQLKVPCSFSYTGYVGSAVQGIQVRKVATGDAECRGIRALKGPIYTGYLPL
jgi:hypothetical protein